jgi:hypothetical protein
MKRAMETCMFRIAFVAIMLCYNAASYAAGIAINEGFEGVGIKQWALLPCFRPEAVFKSDGTIAISGSRSARLDTTALPKLAAKGHNCINGDSKYEPDGSERAELWEPDPLWLGAAADVWYGFSMLITGPIDGQEPRLLIGQWKESGGRSPYLGQRFTGQNFHITIEQEINEAKYDCRVLIASQANKPRPAIIAR